MVDLDIIEPIEEHNDWVNGPVIVEKPHGKLSICLDPRPLYKVIKREPFTFPPLRKYFHKYLVLVFLKTKCFLGMLVNKSR